jgi:hypothetical protein
METFVYLFLQKGVLTQCSRLRFARKRNEILQEKLIVRCQRNLMLNIGVVET